MNRFYFDQRPYRRKTYKCANKHSRNAVDARWRSEARRAPRVEFVLKHPSTARGSLPLDCKEHTRTTSKFHADRQFHNRLLRYFGAKPQRTMHTDAASRVRPRRPRSPPRDLAPSRTPSDPIIASSAPSRIAEPHRARPQRALTQRAPQSCQRAARARGAPHRRSCATSSQLARAARLLAGRSHGAHPRHAAPRVRARAALSSAPSCVAAHPDSARASILPASRSRSLRAFSPLVRAALLLTALRLA